MEQKNSRMNEWADKNIPALLDIDRRASGTGLQDISEEDFQRNYVQPLQKNQREFIAKKYEDSQKSGTDKDKRYWAVMEYQARIKDEKQKVAERKESMTYNLPDELAPISAEDNITQFNQEGQTKGIEAPPQGLEQQDMFGDIPEGPPNEVNVARGKIANIAVAWKGQYGKYPTQSELSQVITSTDGYNEEIAVAYEPYIKNYQPPTE